MENTQDTWSERTSPEHSAVTAEKISDASCRKSSMPQAKTFMFLDLRVGGASGAMQERSWETIAPSHGESWMRNTGESPNVDAESTLSQILEEQAQEKYYLSEKACHGILRRADSRGKKLPEVLERALHQQIARAQSLLNGIPTTAESE